MQFSSPQLRYFVEVFAARLPIRNVTDAIVCLRAGKHLKATYIHARNAHRLLTLSTKKSSTEDAMVFALKAIQGAYIARLCTLGVSVISEIPFFLI